MMKKILFFLMWTFSIVSFAQKINVSGTVLDESGLPIIGATVVVVDEPSKGVVSDIDGKFMLSTVDSSGKLKVSYVGMTTLIVPIEGKTTHTIILYDDSELLEEVVVTGYQTLSKERATGSYNLIKSDQIEKPSTNIGQRLIGTSSGVQVMSDADGNVSFEIRGQSSLMAAAQPLIVVDGFAIQGGLESINPNDVKDITILKDAAATSIWGARSANGVIVITTKSGARDKGVTVNFNSFLKYAPKIDLGYLSPLASSSEIIDYEQKGFNSNFFGGPWSPTPDSNTSLTGGYSQAVEAMNENRLGFLSNDELSNLLDRLRVSDNRGQIKNLMLQSPFTQQYNLSVASQGEKTSSYVSLMYENRKSNYKGTDDEKYNISFRTNANIFKWLDFSFISTFIMGNRNNNGDIYTGSRYDMLLDENGNKTSLPSTFYWPNIERYVPYASFPYKDWSYNPLTEVEERDLKTSTLNSRIQAGLAFKLIDGLLFDTKFQYEILNAETRNYYMEGSYFVRQLVNTTSSWDRTTDKVAANLPKGGILDQGKTERTSYNWRNQLTFNREFFGRDQLSAIAGMEIQNIVYKTTESPRTYGYDDDRLTVGTFPNGVGGSGALQLKNWLGANQTFAYIHKFSHATDRYVSFYVNASYTIDNKYTISGSARTDASNLITDDPKYRYAPFWSVGASWNLSREDFMRNYNWIDRLIVRTTYGYNGNVDKSTSFMPLISVTGSQNIYIQDYTASISSYGNPTLRWEKTGAVDLGVDFDMFKGRMFGKFDFYNKKGRDLIVSMSIPAVNGTKTQKLNMAEMTNRGFEFELGTTNKFSGNNIVWTGSVNFSYNYNVIDKLFKATYNAYDLYGGGTAAYVQGYDANTLWAFKYAGVVNQGTESNPNWQPVVQGEGDDLYDFTGWTPGDGRDYMLDMGTKVAPVGIGLINTFKIYDFDLSFIFTGKFGHKFNGLIFNYPSMSGGSALPNKLYNEILNSDPSKMVPIPFGKDEPRYYFWDRFYPYLDYRVQSANHLRMQELSVAYNVNPLLLRKIGLRSAKVYGQANNLFVLTNNKYNEDPEFPMGSLKPRPTLTFGLNLTF